MKNQVNNLLETANKRLSTSKIGISIETSGNSLYLRATLPPKPDSARYKAHQQRISLSILNIKANPIGIKEAENEAIKISGLLARGQFSWKPYLKSSDIPVTAREWIDKFETHYFNKRSRNPKSQTTWDGDYKAVYSNLSQNESLTLDLLKKAILTTTPDSRQRKRYVNALKNLGEFAGLNCDSLNDLSGSYSSSKTVERNIPSDLEIIETELLISNPQWLWAFRMMAAYGLRPHEIFHVDFSQFPILKVTGGKTGARTVYPFHPEWPEEWNLHEIQMPECTGATNRDLGSRVTKAFDRYHIRFSPYDLRHAYAVRTIRYGLDISLAAAYMGHSVKVHSDIYRKWLTEETHKEAHQRLMANPNRPFPPKPKTLTKSCLKNGVEIAAMSRK